MAQSYLHSANNELQHRVLVAAVPLSQVIFQQYRPFQNGQTEALMAYSYWRIYV